MPSLECQIRHRREVQLLVAYRSEAKREEMKRKSEANEAEERKRCEQSQPIANNIGKSSQMQCRERYVQRKGPRSVSQLSPHKRHHEHISGMLPVHHHDLSFYRTIAAVDRCQREGLQSSSIRGRLFRRNGQKIPTQRRTAKSSRCRAVDNTMKL